MGANLICKPCIKIRTEQKATKEQRNHFNVHIDLYIWFHFLLFFSKKSNEKKNLTEQFEFIKKLFNAWIENDKNLIFISNFHKREMRIFHTYSNNNNVNKKKWDNVCKNEIYIVNELIEKKLTFSYTSINLFFLHTKSHLHFDKNHPFFFYVLIYRNIFFPPIVFYVRENLIFFFFNSRFN